MLRDKNLIPLSHQHQHALALCVRIDRASPIPDAECAAWQAEIVQIFHTEIAAHFTAEESVLFPVARRFEELSPLIDEFLADHAALRQYFGAAEAGKMSAPDLSEFAQRLSAHIRKEERQLFERMQESMDAPVLAAVGAQLAEALSGSAQACIVPNETTKLRPAK
jgi:iron-sulfur cluster repair protein YtfE (RIC family)